MKILRPGIVGGLSVAAMLTAALMGIFFFAWRAAGLPFVPFDTFDWQTRVLPGRIIAFGIGSMVTVIRALKLGPTSTTAKTAEQAMAIAEMFIAGLVGAFVVFLILRTARRLHGFVVGLTLGVVFGVPAVLVTLHGSETTSVGPGAGTVWVLGAFLVWGAVVGHAEQRLIGIEKTTGAAADAAVRRIDRRRFLVQLGGTAAVITVAGAVVGELGEARRREAVMMPNGETMRWSATHPLPNANAAVHEPMHQFITLSCISNPVAGDLIGTQRWTGVSLQRLLPDFRLKPGATHLKVRSADQFYEVVSVDAIKGDPRIMLTYAWDGVPLSREHGFPLRICIPDVNGMKQPKWIECIEAIDHWEAGYWVERGWNKVAQMHATSVIDTVAVDMTMIDADHRKLVPIGGIAHAGARGVSKVEVQVDAGPWERAELRTPLSQLTWVIWRYDWPYQSGRHTFTVRCYEGNGTPQIATPSPPEPNGATGLDIKSMML